MRQSTTEVTMKPKDIPPPKLILVVQLIKEAHSFMEAEKCAESVLNRTSDILGTELGSVMLLDEKNKQLFIKKAKGLDEEIVKITRVKVGEGIAGWVAKEGAPLLIKDLARDKRFRRFRKKQTKRYNTDSLLSVPLKVGGKIIGVINVNNKKTRRIFTREDMGLLSFIAEQVALAIQNALIHEDTKRMADLKLDFISNISHELKNPLTVIRHSISHIRDGLTGKIDGEKAHVLDIAVRNIDRLNRLLDSLLDLAKLEAGKALIQRSYMDLRKLIKECVDFIKTAAEAKGIKIKITFSIKYSRIWADRDRITQLINNLLSNALKFTPKGGRITVGVKENNGKIFICVEDSGIGIRKEDLPRLFNKFEQVNVPKTDRTGMGLGLAICKEIVDIHKGRLWAESSLHKGSRFNVILPKDLRREEKVSA